MTFRPYPNADRARRQLYRHVRYVEVTAVVPPDFARLARSLNAAFRRGTGEAEGNRS